MSKPRTESLIEKIRQRDGGVGLMLGNTPEEWVVLARELERELAAVTKERDDLRSALVEISECGDSTEHAIARAALAK